MLKDNHDSSLNNLISILNKEDDYIFKIDSKHYSKKNCTGKKYLATHDINSIKKNPFIKDKTVLSDISSNRNNMISMKFYITNDAKSKMGGNHSLIVESNDKNLLPENYNGNNQITVSLDNTLNIENIEVISVKNLEIHSLCDKCKKVN